jgi:DNA-binding response OmpR family regulator
MSEAVTTPRQKKPRIVLVEDEKELSTLFAVMIRDWFKEAELVRFENGDAAWQELSQTKPDLLITDLIHPGLTGGELARKLAEQQVTFPVLIISGSTGDWFQEFAGLGIKVAFLNKPFPREDFWQLLNDLAGPCDFPANHLTPS